MSLRSPMGRVLGLGSAKSGVHHWSVQRYTAIALVPLGLWFVLSIAALPLDNHAAVSAWIVRGWNPVFLVLFVLALTWHSMLGVQVVIEDYVHGAATKGVSLILCNFVHVIAGAAGVFAILRLAARGLG